MLLKSIAVFGSLAVGAVAWNKDVHQQIGYGAEQFLNPTTTSIIHQILEPKYNGSIGRAAAWADDYAHTDEGRFSYQWHWIDATDKPPSYCNVYYHRDCPKGGCVVSAIANQTQILSKCIARAKSGLLQGGTSLECSYALKWVVHFLGDIAQPLHASGVAAGGNGINVVFGNHSTELHAVWDGWIVYADANVTEFSNTTIQPFFSHLVSRIRSDDFLIPSAEWITCSNPARSLECALEWARDSNAWNCDYVFSQPVNNTDLATSGYATGAFPIVELQISKAVLRLSTWLNRMVASGGDQRGDLVLQTELSWLQNGGK